MRKTTGIVSVDLEVQHHKEDAMGGINHQPCRPYLDISTKLSRAISQAQVQLWEANIYLENVILDELGAETGPDNGLLRVQNSLRRSLAGIADARSQIHALRERMEQNGYSDLPPLRTLALETMGAELVRRRRTSVAAWKRMVGMMRSKGFCAVLGHYDERLQAIREATTSLQGAMQTLERQAGSAVEALETNSGPPVRDAFALALHLWLEFDEEFLASSLLTAQVWYSHEGHPLMTKGGSEATA